MQMLTHYPDHLLEGDQVATVDSEPVTNNASVDNNELCHFAKTRI